MESPLPPEKFPPADNLPAKIRPARRPPVTGRLFWGSDPIIKRLFYEAGDILIKEKYIKCVIISTRADFSWWRHFNVTTDRRFVCVVALVVICSQCGCDMRSNPTATGTSCDVDSVFR